MSIYRGAGGASDATNDATVNAVAGYASAAASSATNAATSAANAATSAGAANTSVTSATTQASNAATSASNAASSASSAAGSVTSAATQASNAATSASNASTSASNASTSASSASTSATTASSAASSSSASAGTATTKATEAATSAASALAIYGNTTAMNAAVTASQTAASNAATSASSAATSTASALVYKDDAAGFASDANASYIAAAAAAAYAATTVAGFDGNVASAITSAANASASASAAATSANNASTSATQAAASAAGATAIVTGVASTRPDSRPSLLLDFADTRVLDPRITFTRASTATFYDKISSAVAEQNLLTYSQDYTNALWSKGTLTVTANATTAPDGTTTANSLTGSAGVTYIAEITPITTGLTYTFSIYAKVGTTNFIQIDAGTNPFGTNVWANFDLSAGVVGTVGSSTTASIVSVGSGWYRCVISGVATSTTTVNNSVTFLVVESASSVRQPTNVGATNIYVWGAQLEQRSAVTAYTPTTTAAITNYIPVMQTAASGAARFDCNPVTRESLGLLIEESRTNLLTYSSELDNAAWTKTASAITANTIISPDGALTGDKVVENSTPSVHTAEKTFSVTSGTTYTVSTFIKKAERAYALIALTTGFPLTAIQINLTTGAVTTGTGTPLNAFSQDVGNGWFKVGFSLAANSTTTASANFYTSTDGAWANRVYLGDGYSGLYIWGAQLEAGAFATSYIPTVASQVARAADAATIAATYVAQFYSAALSTLYAEVNPMALPYGGFSFLGTGNDFVMLQASRPDVANRVYTITRSNGVNYPASQSNSGVILNTGALNKISATFAVGSSTNALNNVLSSTASGTVIPTLVNPVLYLSSNAAGGTWTTNTNNGTIKRIAYYPVALTSTQLQALTS